MAEFANEFSVFSYSLVSPRKWSIPRDHEPLFITWLISRPFLIIPCQLHSKTITCYVRISNPEEHRNILPASLIAKGLVSCERVAYSLRAKGIKILRLSSISPSSFEPSILQNLLPLFKSLKGVQVNKTDEKNRARLQGRVVVVVLLFTHPATR